MLELFDAHGLVSNLGGVVASQGVTAPHAALLPVVEKLKKLAVRGIASSDKLAHSTQAPSFIAMRPAERCTSGLTSEPTNICCSCGAGNSWRRSNGREIPTRPSTPMSPGSCTREGRLLPGKRRYMGAPGLGAKRNCTAPAVCGRKCATPKTFRSYARWKSAHDLDRRSGEHRWRHISAFALLS